MKLPFVLLLWGFLWNPVHSQPEETLDIIIAWEEIPYDRLYRLVWPVAGVQDGERLYLCRALVGTNYISGKLRVGETTRCIVANNGRALHYEKFEVLTQPPDTTSWLRMPTDGSVPEGTIRSGTSDSGREQYVCRGNHKVGDRIDVIPGKYAPYQKICYIVVGGKEVAAKTGGILVINGLGQALGVTQLLRSSPDKRNTTGSYSTTSKYGAGLLRNLETYYAD